MTSRPIDSRRQSKPQKTSFNEYEEKITAFEQPSGLRRREHNHETQKMVKNLLLCIAFLSMIVIVISYFLMFGLSVDAFRLLFPSVLANLITVLFIYIFTEMLLHSLDKYLVQRYELEQIECFFEEKIEEKLEPIIKEVAVSSTKLTNIERQLKKQEKDFAYIKKMQDIRIAKLEKENVALRKRVEAVEDYLTLPHSA